MQEITVKSANLTSLHKPAEFIKFIQWCAIPDALKEPKTQKELALQLNVEEATLSDWKQRELFYDLVKQEIKKWGKDRTQNVIAGLYRKAVNEGNAQEAKLWLQYFEDWKEKSEIETKNIHYVITRGKSTIEISPQSGDEALYSSPPAGSNN